MIKILSLTIYTHDDFHGLKFSFSQLEMALHSMLFLRLSILTRLDNTIRNPHDKKWVNGGLTRHDPFNKRVNRGSTRQHEMNPNNMFIRWVGLYNI